MLLKEWKINKNDESKPLIERLLSARGITTNQEIKDFMHPLEITLTHPNAFCDMEKAVSRISQAIDKNENILVYGDFDADGLTSTSVMIKTIMHLGGNIAYFIPTRETEGHGLKKESLVKLLIEKKPKLIITVDCGISNVDEVNFINSFKIDVIITDHHEASDNLPDALAIINPKAQNALSEKLTTLEIKYLTSLAGVGVAFKVAQALLEKYDKMPFVYELLPFVALGTIADIVPLIGENRYYVLKGLELISKGKHYGLKRLLENAGYSNIEDGITAEQVAFGIAPRINASGRLDAVDDAIKVLISENKQEIELSVIALENFNRIRQELCHSTFLEADEMAKNIKENAIILYKPDWHVGIIGIVASKLVEKYHKPAFLMKYSEDTNQIRCSARGVEGVSDLNLYDIISNVSEKLDGFGGHALAAGLYFQEENISFEEVKKGLINTIDEVLQGKKITPVLNIDLETTPEDISIDMVENLSQLEPFGASNPQPLFTMNNLILKEKKLMGSNKDHLKLILEKDDKTFNAIWWSKGDIPLSEGDTLDIAFTPQINVFNGNISVQLILKDIHSECLNENEKTASVKIYDHREKTDIERQVNDYLKTSKIDILIFAEEKRIKERLKIYPEICSRVVGRESVKKCDALMLYDYPPDENLYNTIIRTANPKFIHYMHYENFDNLQEFIYTMQGMVRFACNNKNGEFNLKTSASFLGITEELIKSTLQVLEETGMIKIDKKTEDYFQIKLADNAIQKSPETTDLYDTLLSKYEQINDFKMSFKNADIIELYDLDTIYTK